MPVYSFEAITADGQTRKGVIDADSARAARGMLRSQAMVPLSVSTMSSETGSEPDRGGAGAGRRRAPAGARRRAGG